MTKAVRWLTSYQTCSKNLFYDHHLQYIVTVRPLPQRPFAFKATGEPYHEIFGEIAWTR